MAAYKRSVLYSRLPAQFFSLSPPAHASKRMRTGDAKMAARILINIRFVMLVRIHPSIWKTGTGDWPRMMVSGGDGRVADAASHLPRNGPQMSLALLRFFGGSGIDLDGGGFVGLGCVDPNLAEAAIGIRREDDVRLVGNAAHARLYNIDRFL